MNLIVTRPKNTTRDCLGKKGCEVWRSLCGGREKNSGQGGRAANCLATPEGVTDPQDRRSLPWSCKARYITGPGHCVHEGELC